MKRRTFIKGIGLATAGSALQGITSNAQAANIAAPQSNESVLKGLNKRIRPMDPVIGDKVVSCIIIGAGGRGNCYDSYLLQFPGKVKVTGVSDINEFRCNKMADAHQLAQNQRFGDFREILSAPKMADAALICLPDKLHYEAAMMAMEKGYDVLLEKPMAQSAKECEGLLAMSKKKDRILATCHVLRYTPYYIALHQALRDGLIGDLIRIQHTESVERIHMSHSYVRGNWHNSKETTPIILSKSCHDLDIIRWLVGKPCKTVCAQGKLMYFNKEHAPKDAPRKCTDGCPHESTCPYSAIDIYMRRREWGHVIDKKDTDEDILKFLRETNYGTCVFHSDNDQPDYYMANMDFEDGITATFLMEAYTPYGGRVTRIMGSKGFIEGNGHTFTVHDFRSRTQKQWSIDNEECNYVNIGHGGGDYALARDFIEAVAYHDASRLSSTIDVSMESHFMGFQCEKSRKTGKKVNL